MASGEKAVAAIPDWNVVVTLYPGEFRHARRLLRQIAPVARSDYYNVLLMKVADGRAFIERLSELARDRPELLDTISRVSPATEAFDFGSTEEFERRAREVVVGWAPALAGASFFVRMHRRGPDLPQGSQKEERFLDGALLAALADAGTPGRVGFEDPDAVIDVEIVDNRAGLALWTRDDLRACPFLRIR